jgi:hypothetical protein
MNNETIEIKTVPKKNLYEVIASYALTTLLVLLPLFFIPNSHVNFYFAKVGILFFFATVASISLILNIMNERRIGVPSSLFLYIIVFLPFSYFIASLFSKDAIGSLIGSGADVESFFFVALCTLLMVLVARFFRGKQKILVTSLSLMLVSLVITGYLVSRYIFGPTFLSFGIFTKIGSNTIGSFNDVGIFAGLSVIISLLSLDFLSLGKKIKIGLYITLFLSLIITCVSNFYIAINLFNLNIPITLSAVLAFFSLVIFVHKKVSSPRGSFPYVTLAVFLITLVCTVQSQNITSFLQSKIGINTIDVLDVRISPHDTTKLATKVYKEGVTSSIFGVGPNQFYKAWVLYKPTTVNETIFWNKDFNLGFGYVPTAAVTVGLIGVLAWILFLLLILYSIYKLFKSILSSTKDPLLIYSALIVSVGTLYLWFITVTYTPGIVILPLTFLFTGMLGSLLFSEGIISVKYISWEKVGYWKSFTIVFLLVISITVFIGTGYMWSNRLIASIYADKASQSLQGDTPDITKAQEFMAKGLSFNNSHYYLRLYSDISLIRPYQTITKAGGFVPQSDITKEVADDATRAFVAAKYSALGTGKSSDYQDWIQLGKTSEVGMFLGATSTVELAAQAYSQASLLNPTSPTPPYLLGRLYVYIRQKDAAIEQLKKSLKLMPAFTDASKLLDAINANSSNNFELSDPNDIENTIKATTTPKVVIPKNKK